MDAARFDAWTRRRFGLAASGTIAGVLLADRRNVTASKKKRRRKRCIKSGHRCTTGAKRKCCKGRRCDFTGGLSILTLCCGTEDRSCTDDFDCCQGFLCNPATDRCEIL